MYVFNDILLKCAGINVKQTKVHIDTASIDLEKFNGHNNNNNKKSSVVVCC